MVTACCCAVWCNLFSTSANAWLSWSSPRHNGQASCRASSTLPSASINTAFRWAPPTSKPRIVLAIYADLDHVALNIDRQFEPGKRKGGIIKQVNQQDRKSTRMNSSN